MNLSLYNKLLSVNQEHLLAYWEKISDKQRQKLSSQITKLSVETFLAQQKKLQTSKAFSSLLTPFNDYMTCGSSQNQKEGYRLLSSGKAGCLIVAGGDGTRLEFSGPKGLYPITKVKKKTLFQLIAEKTKAASEYYDCPLPVAVMTSPKNDEKTKAYFRENHFFGLAPNQLSFFTQETLPLLDEKGFLFLETPSKISVGPNGNGEALKLFYHSNIWKKWYAQGVRYLNFLLIDNPLADPFDPELLGFHHNNHNEITLKCVKRLDPNEKVGVIINENGSPTVIEYSELPEEERFATEKNGTLKHLCANISLFCFSLSFIEKNISKMEDLPLHIAKKSAKSLDTNGKTITSSHPNAYKFEKFIFDLLPLSKKIKALLYPREECYAPLKNLHGSNSPLEVQKALFAKEKDLFLKSTGLKLPDERLFELSMDFYYPSSNFLKRWTTPLQLEDLPSYIE